MSGPLVEFAIDGGVADIRLNRPLRHNALDIEMCRAIVAAGERLRAESAVRVAVLSGNGASFCAGLDLALMRAMLAGGDETAAVMGPLLARDDGPDNFAQRVAFTWRAAPVPVIAAVHGAAFGGGLQMALGCDLRIAAPSARLSIMEARYGLVPDMSITCTLPRLLARDVALELTLSARELDGAEAARLGLVTRLAEEPRGEALALARTIAARSPEAVRAVKRLYSEAWDADDRHALALEEALQLGLVGSPNQREAVAAAMQGREPAFTDPEESPAPTRARG